MKLSELEALVSDFVTDCMDCHDEVRRIESALLEVDELHPISRTGLFVINPEQGISDSPSFKHSWIQIPAEDIETAVTDVIVDPTVQQFATPDLQPEGYAPLDLPSDTDVLFIYMVDDRARHYERV